MAFSDQMKERIRKATRAALNQVGRAAKSELKKRISVPVEYDGKEVIRSEAGEPPRKEVGDLVKSIHYRLLPGLTIQSLLLYTTSESGKHLQFGFVHHISGNWVEPRPWWVDEADIRRYRMWLRQATARNLREQDPNDFPSDSDS